MVYEPFWIAATDVVHTVSDYEQIGLGFQKSFEVFHAVGDTPSRDGAIDQADFGPKVVAQLGGEKVRITRLIRRGCSCCRSIESCGDTIPADGDHKFGFLSKFFKGFREVDFRFDVAGFGGICSPIRDFNVAFMKPLSRGVEQVLIGVARPVFVAVWC